MPILKSHYVRYNLQHMFWNLNEVDSYRISFVSLTKDISKEIVMLVDTVNESLKIYKCIIP